MRIYLPYVFESLEWGALTSTRRIKENNFFQIGYDSKGYVEFVYVFDKNTNERRKIVADIIEDKDNRKVIKCEEYLFIYENNRIVSYPEIFNDFSNEKNDTSLLCNITYDNNVIKETSGSTKYIYYFEEEAINLFNKLKETYKALDGEDEPTLAVEFIDGINYNTIYRFFSSKDDISTVISIEGSNKKPKVYIKYLTSDDMQLHVMSGLKTSEEEKSKVISNEQTIYKQFDDNSLYFVQTSERNGCEIELVDTFGYTVYSHTYDFDASKLIKKVKVDTVNESDSEENLDKGSKDVVDRNKKKYTKIANCGTINSYTEYFAVFEINESGMHRVDMPSSNQISRLLDYDF